jgi:hypothetical protein
MLSGACLGRARTFICLLCADGLARRPGLTEIRPAPHRPRVKQRRGAEAHGVPLRCRQGGWMLTAALLGTECLCTTTLLSSCSPLRRQRATDGPTESADVHGERRPPAYSTRLAVGREHASLDSHGFSGPRLGRSIRDCPPYKRKLWAVVTPARQLRGRGRPILAAILQDMAMSARATSRIPLGRASSWLPFQRWGGGVCSPRTHRRDGRRQCAGVHPPLLDAGGIGSWQRGGYSGLEHLPFIVAES